MDPEDEAGGGKEPRTAHDRSAPEPSLDAQSIDSDASTPHKGSAIISEAEPKQTTQENLPPPQPATGPRIIRESISDLDLPEPWLSGDLLRESGVLFGAATALLYLASQVYGAAYLNFFGVSFGFQGIGIGNLSMLSIPDLVILIIFTWWMQALPSRTRSLVLLVGLVSTSGISCIRLFATYGFTGSSQWHDWLVAALGPMTWISVWSWRGQVRYIEEFKKSGASLRNKLDLIPDSTLNPIETRAVSRLIEFTLRRSRQLHARVWLLAGYITMLVAIPGIAWIYAITAAQQEHQRPITQGMSPHVSVYWVGDRSVYVTFEYGKCLVHAQIANAEVLGRIARKASSML